MSKDDPQVNEDGAVTDAEAEATETVEETVVQDEAEVVEAPDADDMVASEAEGGAPEVAADDGSEEAAQVDPMRVVEAVLMAADAPITAQKIAGIMFKLKKPPLITRYAVWLMGRDTYFTADKARRELGWESTVKYTEGVPRTIDWFEGRPISAPVAPREPALAS